MRAAQQVTVGQDAHIFIALGGIVSRPKRLLAEECL
jgi:hypothetical protein